MDNDRFSDVAERKKNKRHTTPFFPLTEKKRGQGSWQRRQTGTSATQWKDQGL
jgi:hypothetical protein